MRNRTPFNRLRNQLFLILSFLPVLLIISCENGGLKQKHPQAALRTSPYQDQESIDQYADSISLTLKAYEKKTSMIYSRGDYSFYITKYSENGQPILYIENGVSGETGNTQMYYYLNNNEVVLYKENTYNASVNPHYKSLKEYFRNNILFNSELKEGRDLASFNASTFVKSQGNNRKVTEKILEMENAINEKAAFNLVFEGITEYPKARYIIFSKDGINPYRAVISVEKEDDFINELVTNTAKYKGADLDISWTIKDNEAIYTSGRIK